MATAQSFRFTDVDQYAASIRAGNITGYVLHDRGFFEARLNRVEIDKLWLQQGSDTLGRSVHCAFDANRCAVVFLPEGASKPLVHAGEEVSGRHLDLIAPGAEFFQRIEAPCSWAAMSLAREDFEEKCRLVADTGFALPSRSQRMIPSPQRMAMLRSLHGSTIRMTGTAIQPEVARAVEHALTVAMIESLATGVERRSSRRWDRHRQIVRNFREWLESNLDRPVYLLEICTALGVPARTLRTCCQEHLGMGPVRYLWLRRMKLARKALLEGGPSDTVTNIVTQFGFWELGRFAASYRALYGETPKATLRRAAS